MSIRRSYVLGTCLYSHTVPSHTHKILCYRGEKSQHALKSQTQSVILGKLPVDLYPVKMSGKEKPCVLPCLLGVWTWQCCKWGTIQNSISVRKKQTNETDDKSFF